MRLKLAAWVVLMVAVVALDVSAQTPRVVRQSGVVRDGAGQPRAGAATLTFGIYAEAEGGAPLWTEVQVVTLDSQGRYAVALGALAPEGLPLALFTSGEARWLGVAVDGGAEPPRIALLSVPYALKAADAETVAGKPLSAFVLAGEQTGTGADGLTYVNTKLLQGAVLGVTPQASSGSAGYLGVFTNSTDLGNSVIFQAPSTNNIGVNTITPAAGFHAVATAAPGAYFDVYNNTLGALPVVYRAARGTPGAPTAVQTDDILGGLAVRGYGATGFSGGQGQVMFRAAEPWTDAAHGTYLQFTTTPVGGAAWTERMRIAPYGYVGLGTATPLFPLDIRTVRGATYARLGFDGAWPLFLIANVPQIGFNAYYEGGHKYGQTGYAGYLSFDPSFGSFLFGTTAVSGSADAPATITPRLTLTSFGNVGIGTTTPIRTLDVAGNVRVSATSAEAGTFSTSAAQGTALTGQADNGSNAWGVYGSSTNGIGVNGSSGSASGYGGQFLNIAATGKAIRALVGSAEVMNVDAGGVHAGPGMTGTPFACGYFLASGVRGGGTSNISCSWDASVVPWRYVCHLHDGATEINYDPTRYAVFVTPHILGFPRIPDTSNLTAVTPNLLVVRLFDLAGNSVQGDFFIVVYKM